MNKDIKLANRQLADSFRVHRNLVERATKAQHRLEVLDALVIGASKDVQEARAHLESLLKGEKTVEPQEGKGNTPGYDCKVTCDLSNFNTPFDRKLWSEFDELCKWIPGNGR